MLAELLAQYCSKIFCDTLIKKRTVTVSVYAHCTTQTCLPCRNRVASEKVTDVFFKEFTVCISGSFDLTLSRFGSQWNALEESYKTG